MNIQEFLNLKTGDRIKCSILEYIVVEKYTDGIRINKIESNLSKYDFDIVIDFVIGEGYYFNFYDLDYPDEPPIVYDSIKMSEFISSWKLITNSTKLSNQEILNLSVSTFPKESHYRQLNEEIGEFNVALSHYFRNRCGIESVIEEIADVKQMLDTWMLLLNISKEDYEKVENEKYQKLLRQINEFKQKSQTDFRKLFEEQKLKGEI